MSFALDACFSTLPRTTRGQPLVLGGDPKGKTFLYTNGNSVIIRDIANPSIAEVYTEHACQTTVAKYSPSGFYIASGDVSGKVRIWDTVNKEHLLKNEFTPFAGKVKDLAWSSDNQRIIAVGEGREKFGHVFNAETGTSVGEIMGVSKSINSCDFKSTRPFRAAVASEDHSLAFFHGPPFKFQFNMTDHDRFVNAVRYAPDGNVFISGGADGKAFVYDGKSGEKVGELGSPAHKGGIYALCFSPDSKEVLTVSGDKTCKIWNVESKSVVVEFNMGTAVEDMQVGCLWQGEYIISVSLSGYINYLDRNNPSQPSRIIKGHNKPITAMAVSEDRSKAYTGSSDGVICCWDVATGASEVIRGKGHSNQIKDMKLLDGNLTTVAMDDTLRITPANAVEYNANSTALDSQPRGVAVGQGGLAIVACVNHVSVLRNGQKISSTKVDYEPSCAGLHPGLTEVAIGGGMDNEVHIYSVNGDTVSETKCLPHNAAITRVEYSPDGQYLAVSDASRNISLYSIPGYETKVKGQWVYHTAKTNTVAWSPDSLHIASGALDTNVIVWSVEKINKRVQIKGAHLQNSINCVAWTDNNTVISAGQDSNVKKWRITHH